jgi:hypothetical protein
MRRRLRCGFIEDPHQPSVDGDAEMTYLENNFMAGMTGRYLRKGHRYTDSHIFLLTVPDPFP